MMSKIKLYNKGQRLITVATGVNLKPGQTMEFPAELGAYLKKLYGDELQDLEEAMKPFTAPAAEPAPAPLVPDKTPEELEAEAFAAEAEKRGLSVEELTAAHLEIASLVQQGATKEDAEKMVFGEE